MHRVSIIRDGMGVAEVTFQGIPVMLPDGSQAIEMSGGSPLPYKSHIEWTTTATREELKPVIDRIASEIGMNKVCGDIDDFTWQMD